MDVDGAAARLGGDQRHCLWQLQPQVERVKVADAQPAVRDAALTRARLAARAAGGCLSAHRTGRQQCRMRLGRRAAEPRRRSALAGFVRRARMQAPRHGGSRAGGI